MSCWSEWHCWSCMVALANPMYCIWAVTYCGHWHSDCDCCCKIWSVHHSSILMDLKVGEFLLFIKTLNSKQWTVSWQLIELHISVGDVLFVELTLWFFFFNFYDYKSVHDRSAAPKLSCDALGLTSRNIEPGSTIFQCVKRCDLRTWGKVVRFESVWFGWQDLTSW